jgi:hypothetical protein
LVFEARRLSFARLVDEALGGGGVE